MSELKEYIVTLKNYEDLNNFYDDMETLGGSITIPNRKVECSCRRTISRNTHYMLSDEEAEQVRNDSRVLACEEPASKRGIFPIHHWTQTGNFEKSSTVDTNDKNWGLYRCIRGSQVSNWGSDSTSQQSSISITTTSSGKNVDVVIVDGHINPDHPEFAVNADGSGGSRVNQFNWFSYSSALGYSTGETYTYSTSGTGNNNTNHGTHVAGTVAGNTQGWARDANIYNMAFQDSLSGIADWDEKLWDYLRYFHKNKAVNASTGRRNPTITNHSWGYSYSNINLSSVSSVDYRGTTTAISGTDAQRKTTLEANGIPVPGDTYLYAMPARVAAVDADIQDAISDGVIVIASAGNSYWPLDISGGNDWSNYLVISGSNYFPVEGPTPGSADNVICVGSIGSKVAEYKGDYSNFGERIDIWAPGTNIISAVYDTTAATEFSITLVNDPRNSSYKLGSISGTSMASPQVCGVIACLAEQQQDLRQADALQYLIENSISNVGDYGGTGTTSPYEGFGDSRNRYLFYKSKRSETGSLQKAIFGNRNPNTSGTKYPRTNNKITKRV